MSSDNILVNSCQYTPIYLIENPSVSEPKSYIITQNNQITQRPVGDTLKKFYENSGKLENNLFDSPECGSKPRVLKKLEGNLTGNNLKLASFLMPKNENLKQQTTTPTNSVVLKPLVVTNSSTILHTTPHLDINRKIVKIKDIPKTFNNAKILPKIKPKDNPPSLSKHTSVQLLKLGETYHSLNDLSDDQMKIVNHALKIFSNPQKTQEPTYDPITNTKFIYKVVSPKDLTIVGKNKVIFKQKKHIIKKEVIRKTEKKELEEEIEENEEKSHFTETQLQERILLNLSEYLDCNTPSGKFEVLECIKTITWIDLENAFGLTKVTRSGRKVKLPKNILPETEIETPQKPRKRSGTIVSCFQCSAEFSSLYRLQRHYENHPTHIPARIHSNLFHCLLAIIKGGSEADGAAIFLQQLEQLITKLRSLIPCLLTRPQGAEGKQSMISDDIGRLFGVEPGKYHLNIEALTCVKTKDGYCRHNPQPPAQPNNHSQVLSGNNELIDADDCARINSADKWPTVSKRMEGRKVKPDTPINEDDSNAKKMKLNNELDSHIDMGMDDIVAFLNGSDQTKMEIKTASDAPDNPLMDETSCDVQIMPNTDESIDKLSKPTHVQFHSAHFDIRSSPIKPSSTIFRKFKIDPDKIARYDPQIIRPLALSQDNNFTLENSEVTQDNCNSLQADEIFNEEISISCKETEELTFDTSKTWTVADQPDYLKPSTLNDESSDSYIKPSALIEPALLHIKDSDEKTDTNESNHNHEINDARLMPNTSQSVLTFLDSLGNSVDFQLDLFS